MKKKVLAVLASAVGGIAGMAATKYLMGKTVERKNEKIIKFKGYYGLLNQWFALKQEGKTLEQYFVNNSYKTVAIYGMGEMGLRLYEDLKNSGEIEIKYAIDQGVALCEEIEVLSMDDPLPDVDVVVVTATFAFEEIAEKLEQRIDCAIVSLEDVIYEI